MARPIAIIVGMPERSGSLRREAPPGADVLISANRCWHPTRGFLEPDPEPWGNIALDSAGFVATRLYGGYRWPMAEYVDFACLRPWRWWAAMDYCCEPEIAGDEATVRQRVDLTVESAADCLAQARWWRDEEGATWATDPMPVLQGWRPEHYLRCVDGLTEAWGDLPELMGLGSVCRRNVHGRDGLLAIIGALDARLPPHVRLHLFGVKSAALSLLAGHRRIASMDSCAWDFAARVTAREEKVSCTTKLRGEHMRTWYARQLACRSPEPSRQADLFG